MTWHHSWLVCKCQKCQLGNHFSDFVALLFALLAGQTVDRRPGHWLVRRWIVGRAAGVRSQHCWLVRRWIVGRAAGVRPPALQDVERLAAAGGSRRWTACGSAASKKRLEFCWRAVGGPAGIIFAGVFHASERRRTADKCYLGSFAGKHLLFKIQTPPPPQKGGVV